MNSLTEGKPTDSTVVNMPVNEEVDKSPPFIASILRFIANLLILLAGIVLLVIGSTYAYHYHSAESQDHCDYIKDKGAEKYASKFLGIVKYFASTFEHLCNESVLGKKAMVATIWWCLCFGLAMLIASITGFISVLSRQYRKSPYVVYTTKILYFAILSGLIYSLASWTGYEGGCLFFGILLSNFILNY